MNKKQRQQNSAELLNLSIWRIKYHVSHLFNQRMNRKWRKVNQINNIVEHPARLAEI